MTINEDDLVFVVWSNAPNAQGRPFETMTKQGSRLPVAWRLSYLQEKYYGLFPQAHLVFSEEDLRSWMSPPLNGSVTRENPLLIPVRYAQSVLAWGDYDIWEGDHEAV